MDNNQRWQAQGRDMPANNPALKSQMSAIRAKMDVMDRQGVGNDWPRDKFVEPSSKIPMCKMPHREIHHNTPQCTRSQQHPSKDMVSPGNAPHPPEHAQRPNKDMGLPNCQCQGLKRNAENAPHAA